MKFTPAEQKNLVLGLHPALRRRVERLRTGITIVVIILTIASIWRLFYS